MSGSRIAGETFSRHPVLSAVAAAILLLIILASVTVLLTDLVS